MLDWNNGWDQHESNGEWNEVGYCDHDWFPYRLSGIENYPGGLRYLVEG